MKTNRRSFLKTAAVTAASFTFGSMASAKEKSRSGNILFDLGVCSYTFRAFKNEQIIPWMKECGLKYISIKDFHLAMKSSDEECAALAKMYEDAGLKVYSCGVVYMRKEADVENAFRYAKALGCSSIVGVPVYNLLPLVEKKVKETGIAIGIHNHGPGDKLYPSAESIMDKIADLDPRIGITLDIGHTIRIGKNPAEAVRKYASRILDFHFKDMNKANPKGSGVICGKGVIDLPDVIKSLVEIKYDKIAAFEYEIDKDNPLPGLKKSVEYIRGLCEQS